MVFFCHGTGSTWNSYQNSRRHLYKNRNQTVRKIRARARRHVISSPISKCTCATARHLSSKQSQLQSSDSDSKKLQEETETDEVNELKDEVSLEQVPFEIIEAEDILLWGCPPHKIPRVTKSTKSTTRISLDKAASFPMYYKCHWLPGSWSERFDYDTWNDFFTDFDDQYKQTSDHDFNANIPREFSWSTFNPFQEFESFNDFEDFLFPQLFKSPTVSCQIYDVPVEDDKAVVLVQPPKFRKSNRARSSQSPIIHEYTSEDEDGTCRSCRGRTADSGSIIITELKSCGGNVTKCTAEKNKGTVAGESIEAIQDSVCTQLNMSKKSIPPETNVLYEGNPSGISCNESNSIAALDKHQYCSKPMDIFGVRIIHSLPGIFTVYNVETNNFPGKTQGTDRKHRRRKAVSVAITDQCHDDFTEEPATQELTNVLQEQTLDVPNDPQELVTPDGKTEFKDSSKTDTGNPGSSTRITTPKPDPETVELFRATQLLSSSSKILPRIQSAVTIHLRTRSSPSVPSSGSLLSFSPVESFASSVETSPVNINIEEEAFGRSQNDGLEQSFYPQSSESIDEENFYKFYPPPTPLSKSSILKCKTLEKSISCSKNSTRSDPSTASCENNNQDQKIFEDSNTCIICNQVFVHSQQGDETKFGNQKAALKKSQNKRASSVRFKVDHQASQNAKPLTASSSLLTTDTELPEIMDIKFLKHGIPSVSSTGPDSPGKFTIQKSSRNIAIKLRSAFSKSEAIDDERNNNTHIPSKSPIATSLEKSKSHVKPVSPIVKEKHHECSTAEESTEVLKMGHWKQTSSSSATKASRSSKLSQHDRLTKQKKRVTHKKQTVPLHPDKIKISQTDKGGNLSPTSRNARSRRRNKPYRNMNSSNSCSSEESNNSRRKAGLKKEHDRRRYYRNLSESPTDRSLSSESKTYQQRRRRRKKRRKQNLWQKMIQYFFGCECHSKTKSSYSSLRETDSSPNGFYGGDYKPRISFFERIVIWWRRKTHRQIVVRQDSVQLFRIKRRRWLKEIHEFYEDLRTVSKNVREAEKKRSKNKNRHRNPPVAKMVNSEGCILLRNPGVRIDTLNGNKPKEKPVDPKPARGILKNTNNLPLPSKHISYK
ncbi:unnamed protein product [Allacma fusca]|uniref:Uncharacterized protein n=1 Tax=Allacma fusca TaxID=39272 RepID=A0A8J2JY29_9HEXA|nr:unnamed protein product [Allacma fusca]